MKRTWDRLRLSHQRECLRCNNGHGLPILCVKWPYDVTNLQALSRRLDDVHVIYVILLSIRATPLKIKHKVIQPGDRGDFWAQPVEILVFASPAGYKLTSSRFPLLNLGIFYKFILNDW